MATGDITSACWGLDGFEIAWVELQAAPTKAVPGRKIQVLGLRDLRGGHTCSGCGRWHRHGVHQETTPRRWRECSVGDFETYVEITPWRVACCGGTRVESFPWEQKGFRMTKRFFLRVAALCTRLPVSEVAKMGGLSWDTVARVDKEAIKLGLGGDEPDIGCPRWIGVDEVSRTGGRSYFTVVTDLENGRVLSVAEGKGARGMKAFLDRFPNRLRRRVTVTATDLGYMSLMKEVFPTAAYLLDRFHIIKWVNEGLNTLRNEEHGAAPKTSAGRTIKAKKWMLQMGREKLEHGSKLVLAQLMKLNRRLCRGYLLKEELRSLLQHPWTYLGAARRNLEAWCTAVMRSRLEPLKAVARRLRPHIESIVAAFAHPDVPMGLVEETNGKIGKLRRNAHGYRDTEYFKLKIYQRCSLPDNPYAYVVL